MIRFVREATAAIVVVALASACSGSSDTLSQAELDLVASSIEEVDDPNALQYTSDEAGCLAEALAETMGRARLVELGLDVDRDQGPSLDDLGVLSDTEVTAVVDATFACADITGKVAEQFAASGFDATDADCVAQAYVDSGVLRESLMTSDFDPALNERIDTAIADAMSSCGVG